MENEADQDHVLMPIWGADHSSKDNGSQFSTEGRKEGDAAEKNSDAQNLKNKNCSIAI